MEDLQNKKDERMKYFHKIQNKISLNINELINATNQAQLARMLEIFMNKKILNEYMLNEIKNAENPTRAFYEKIPKRGPGAYRELKEALISVGLMNIYKLLQEPRNFLHSYSENHDGNVNSTERSHAADSIDNASYNKGTELLNGLVLVIDINNLRHNQNSSYSDIEKLYLSWTKLGFNVEKISKDFSKNDFEKFIGTFIAREDLKKMDALFIFILSHGKIIIEGLRGFEIELANNEYISSDYIINKFEAPYCPNMAEKPKVIIFQACRGKYFEKAPMTDGFSPLRPSIKTVPSKLSDTLVVYSILQDCLPHERAHKGFIQQFCDILDEKEGQLEIEEIIDEVSRRLKAEANEISTYEIPYSEKFGFDKTLHLRF